MTYFFFYIIKKNKHAMLVNTTSKYDDQKNKGDMDYGRGGRPSIDGTRLTTYYNPERIIFCTLQFIRYARG